MVRGTDRVVNKKKKIFNWNAIPMKRKLQNFPFLKRYRFKREEKRKGKSSVVRRREPDDVRSRGTAGFKSGGVESDCMTMNKLEL